MEAEIEETQPRPCQVVGYDPVSVGSDPARQPVVGC